MRLPRKLQQHLIEKCGEALSCHADRLPCGSYLGEAHRQGTLSVVLERMLPPFAAELRITEGAQLAALAKEYPATQPGKRGPIEDRFQEIVLRVADRLPAGKGDWEQALTSVRALARSVYGTQGQE